MSTWRAFEALAGRGFAAVALLSGVAVAQHSATTPVAANGAEQGTPMVTSEPTGSVEVQVRRGDARAQADNSTLPTQGVNLAHDRDRSADLGAVLARQPGVSYRSSGGLGAFANLSLDGFGDDRVRVFLDGLPLAVSGFSLGVGTIPLGLLESVNIHRGVVPLRLAADALAGAVELNTLRGPRGLHGTASYQQGSFHTRRFSASLTERGESGRFLRAYAFVDRSQNDYEVDVDVADPTGQLTPTRIRRFHDGYAAHGVGLQAGVLNRPWATRLLVGAFVSSLDKELQNNVAMTVPYGEPRYGKREVGANLRYAHALADGLQLELAAALTRVQTDFEDLGQCVYSWRGDCTFPLLQPGEITERARDQRVVDTTLLARGQLAYRVSEGWNLRALLAPTRVERSGEDRRTPAGDYDPLRSPRSVDSLTFGAEQELELLRDRLSSVVFVKGYAQWSRAEERLPSSQLRQTSSSALEPGLGGALRLALADPLYLKLAYEWAVRLPRPDELFGDGVLVIANLALVPERSHNASVVLGLADAQPAWRGQPLGTLRGGVEGNWRRATDLISLFPEISYFQSRNVLDAQGFGFKLYGAYTAPGDGLELTSSLDAQDLRNRSREGYAADYAGDRLPNRPFLFWNAQVRGTTRDWAGPGTTLALTLLTRYTHEFFRSWESLGASDSKQRVPSQWAHDVVFTHSVSRGTHRLAFSLELQNLTDAALFDVFGQQRPGRAVFGKLAAEL